MASQLRSRHFVQTIQRVAAVVSVLIVVIGTYWYAYMVPVTSGERSLGGIVCSDVHRQAKAFLANVLDEETAGKIRRHLAGCPQCRKLVEKLRSQDKPLPKATRQIPRHAWPVDHVASTAEMPPVLIVSRDR